MYIAVSLLAFHVALGVDERPAVRRGRRTIMRLLRGRLRECAIVMGWGWRQMCLVRRTRNSCVELQRHSTILVTVQYNPRDRRRFDWTLYSLITTSFWSIIFCFNRLSCCKRNVHWRNEGREPHPVRSQQPTSEMLCRCTVRMICNDFF